MGHIELKRTKFKKGNFRPRWVVINNDLATFGKIKQSKVYMFHLLPYWYPLKITVMALKHRKFYEHRSIMNWLA